MKSNKPRARQAKGLARSQILKAMSQITISNAHGHTVTISGEYNDLIAYLKHLGFLIAAAKTYYEKVDAEKLQSRASEDWSLIHDAIEILKAES